MRRTALVLATFTVLGGCAEVTTLGATGIEHRRMMNDSQARATMAAACDISLGAYSRELTISEQRYTALICGGHDALDEINYQQAPLSGTPDESTTDALPEALVASP